MTETDPEKRLIGYACLSTYGQTLDTQLSRAHLRQRRGSGISRLTDPTAVAQLWLRAGSLCPRADRHSRRVWLPKAQYRPYHEWQCVIAYQWRNSYSTKRRPQSQRNDIRPIPMIRTTTVCR